MNVSRETRLKLDEYIALVRDEATKQNLVSKATLEAFEIRHIEDSAQLLDHAPMDGHWLDIGSGAGLPGIVLAILGARVRLVESRRLRSAFLEHVIQVLELTDRASLHAGRLETMPVERFDRITARAYAPMPKLLETAFPFSARDTIWVLPKGRTATSELDSVRGTWHGDFEVVPSRTDAEAAIIIASNVHPMGRRTR